MQNKHIVYVSPEKFFSIAEKNIHQALQRTLTSWRSDKKIYQPAQTVGHVTLYSYSNPCRETAPKNSLRSHFSPSLIRMRLKHANLKNIIYIDKNGVIQYPALMIRIKMLRGAHQLSQAFSPLTPDHFPGLTTISRFAVKSFSFLTTLHSRMNGEKILLIFCAEDHSYFGSVSICQGQHIISVHCTNMEAMIVAMKRFKTLLSSHDRNSTTFRLKGGRLR